MKAVSSGVRGTEKRQRTQRQNQETGRDPEKLGRGGSYELHLCVLINPYVEV